MLRTILVALQMSPRSPSTAFGAVLRIASGSTRRVQEPDEVEELEVEF